MNSVEYISAQQSGTLQPVSTLPTITEAKVVDARNPQDANSQLDSKRPPRRTHRSSEGDTAENDTKNMPRNASQPAFTSHQQGNARLLCL